MEFRLNLIKTFSTRDDLLLFRGEVMVVLIPLVRLIYNFSISFLRLVNALLPTY